MHRRLVVLLTALFALVPVAAARAAWFPAQAIDGPNADVVSVGGVDLARDGGGAVAYLRRDGGFPHAFVSRIAEGAWRPPERVDGTIGSEATEIKVAVGDGNRLVVAWIADGGVFASVVNGGPGLGPYIGPVQIGGPGAKSLDLDMGINGAAYAVWQQGGDVRAARLQDTTWTPVGPSLDIDPADEAGTGALRPRVAVSAEGYAVATWGEVVAGRKRVFARRITGINLSVAPQDLTLDSFGGAPGGNADSPDIDIEDDGSFAWVVFREDLGASHTIARRLVGSQFEAPAAIDGGVASAEPRIDMNGVGQGEGVAQALDNGAVGALLDRDKFEQSFRLDSTGSLLPSAPEVASTDRGDLAVAWRVALADGTVQARARFKPFRQAFGGDTPVSRAELGPVADPGVFIGGDRVGDFAVAMAQGAPVARTLAVAVYDRPPGPPFIAQSQAYKRQTRPTLSWRPGLELWGAQTFRVLVDGQLAGTTTDSKLVPAQPLRPGRHVWQVEAVDRVGQTARSRARTLRIDSLAPRLSVKVGGKRRAGEALKISVSAVDRGGSGLDHITVDYGDRSRTTRERRTTHRYRRGRWTLKVAAVDKAGNVARKQVRLRIKKK